MRMLSLLRDMQNTPHGDRILPTCGTLTVIPTWKWILTESVVLVFLPRQKFSDLEYISQLSVLRSMLRQRALARSVIFSSDKLHC